MEKEANTTTKPEECVLEWKAMLYSRHMLEYHAESFKLTNLAYVSKLFNLLYFIFKQIEIIKQSYGTRLAWSECSSTIPHQFEFQCLIQNFKV